MEDEKHTRLEELLLMYSDEEFLIANGLDDAVIGVDTESMRLIYSVDKVKDILMKEMPYEEAMEYFEFNIAGSFVGPKTPIWCYDNF